MWCNISLLKICSFSFELKTIFTGSIQQMLKISAAVKKRNPSVCSQKNLTRRTKLKRNLVEFLADFVEGCSHSFPEQILLEKRQPIISLTKMIQFATTLEAIKNLLLFYLKIR